MRDSLRCEAYRVAVNRAQRDFAFANLRLEDECWRLGSVCRFDNHNPHIFVIPSHSCTVLRSQVRGELESTYVKIARRRVDHSFRSKEKGKKEIEEVRRITVDYAELEYKLADKDGTTITLSGEVWFSDAIVDDIIDRLDLLESKSSTAHRGFLTHGVVSLEHLEKHGYRPPYYDRVQKLAIIEPDLEI